MPRKTGYYDSAGHMIHEGDWIRAKYGYEYRVIRDASSGEWMVEDRQGLNRMPLSRVAGYSERIDGDREANRLP
jgi:hypothetical protein